MPLGEEQFFSHEPRRPPKPLSDATRYLCAAAYLDRGFANRVITQLLATRRAVAPSINFDAGPVLRHCLRARRNILRRDVVLVVIALASLCVIPFPTLDFLLACIVLGALLPNATRARGGPTGTVVFALSTTAGTGLVVAFTLLLAERNLGSSYLTRGCLPGFAAGFAGLAVVAAVLLAATWATEVAYASSALRTLIGYDLRAMVGSAESTASEERIALVEGAQHGNIALFGGDFPFVGAGFKTGNGWSIAVELASADSSWQAVGARESDRGYIRIDPVELHRQVRQRLDALNDASLPENERIASLTISDRLIGSGSLHWTSPLVDLKSKTSYSHASLEAVESLIRHPQAGLRYYQQVSVRGEDSWVISHGRQVIGNADQGITVSAFFYAAVEGRMLYLQFVPTVLPPVPVTYRVIDFWERRPSGVFFRTLAYSTRSFLSSVAFAPIGVFSALRLRLLERRARRVVLKPTTAISGEFGALASIREMGTEGRLTSYLHELEVDKYNKMIARLILEAVQDFLISKGVDNSSFENSASSIVSRADIDSSGNYSPNDRPRRDSNFYGFPQARADISDNAGSAPRRTFILSLFGVSIVLAAVTVFADNRAETTARLSPVDLFTELAGAGALLSGIGAMLAVWMTYLDRKRSRKQDADTEVLKNVIERMGPRIKPADIHYLAELARALNGGQETAQENGSAAAETPPSGKSVLQRFRRQIQHGGLNEEKS